ncbi:MAG TPA: cysteine--tRNA ligase [Actinomycetota bacterium]|jgi:cysteinyl-tRNA synthetase|nr:cysteine--tRNA ligase [Actinomycetota bacterium]
MIRFTNTLGGEKKEFTPLSPPRVTLYACGPTVYDVPHVGHARLEIVFDVLRRYLRWRGFDVFYVRNVTDVDDKIINRANEEGVDAFVIADRYTRAYDDAMRDLNVLPPDVAPRASGHIIEMQDMIGRLIDAGCAYPGEGSVYFAVEKFDGYGKLSGRGLEQLANRERVEPAPGKHHALDFALWKAAKPGEPAWPSPWGPGRPGWHIECSVMATRYLGQPFDIHGGGADLIFPHHENEIAQSEALETPFACLWLHEGHLNFGGEKMSKSTKNYVEVTELLRDHQPQVVRMLFCIAHYRSQMDFVPEALAEARSVWERFRGFLRIAPTTEADKAAIATRLAAFGEAMDDDLNTPAALAALHELVRDGHSAIERGEDATAGEIRSAVVEALDVLGCATEADERSDLVGPLVDALLAEREAARARKDFDRADAIRNRLTEIGITVEDSASGPRWFLS